MAATLTDEDIDAIWDREVAPGLPARLAVTCLWAVLIGQSDTTTAPGWAIFLDREGAEVFRAPFSQLTGARGAATIAGG